MNWVLLRQFPWLDTRARFVATAPRAGALLDLGSSDGETLRHIAEREKLPWPDRSMDAITCMHLIEHLRDLTLLVGETARLLKPGGRVYFETPGPKSLAMSSLRGAAAGRFTLNFFDDATHVRLVPVDELAQQVNGAGLEVLTSGTSRNWIFAASWPLFALLPASRQKFTAKVHWVGWSAYLIAHHPR
jgi:2-polyprenyl-3-methyl-5-hydroxy-6-metoxy-1,4-benzoquinol methylase